MAVLLFDFGKDGHEQLEENREKKLVGTPSLPGTEIAG
jgi:hypothetical protein